MKRRSMRGNYDAERIKEVDGGVRSDGRRGKVEEEEKVECIEEGGGWGEMGGETTWRRMKRRWVRRRKEEDEVEKEGKSE
jgi:hypothetical protein